MCVRTYRRGLGVACSDTMAIPEPRNAEQQQCSPAFFVESGAAVKLTTAFFCVKLHYLPTILKNKNKYENKILFNITATR